MKLVLTCEHAGNQIPRQYKPFFEDAEDILSSHRGYDPGAFDLFCFLREISHYNKDHQVSRLLVEINRSPGHKQLFSEFTKDLPVSEKDKILELYYFPYRKEVEEHIEKFILKGEQVLHLSVHSFTPVWHGEVRKADIGLLYDPGRNQEKLFCQALKKHLLQEDKSLNIRFNYPYLGKADGFTTFLRKKFPKDYLGIEIEVNQKFTFKNEFPAALKMNFLKALSGLF